nr:hypothetical protein [Endozoicomonas sp.]
MTIAAYDTGQWVSLFGLSLKVNNKAVTPFEINIPDSSGFMDDQADDFNRNAKIQNNLKTIEEAAMDTGTQIEMDSHSRDGFPPSRVSQKGNPPRPSSSRRRLSQNPPRSHA